MIRDINQPTVPSQSSKLHENAHRFIASVLELQPRIAVFDCDGTLWCGDAGADFFYWEMDRGLLSSDVADWALPRYADYKAGKVDEGVMCGEMVSLHRGIPVDVIERAAAEFFAEKVVHRIFPEMQQLTRQLAARGCELWAVSSTNEWVVREGSSYFGISGDHILATCVYPESGFASDRLIRVPTGEAKAEVIRKMIPGSVDVVFGNSMHDAAMMATAQHAFAVNPNPDLEKFARQHGWTVYFPGTIDA